MKKSWPAFSSFAVGNFFFLVFCDRLGVGLTKSQKTDGTEMFRTGLENLAGSNDWNPGHSSLGHQMAS
jgi:hypothetical protein